MAFFWRLLTVLILAGSLIACVPGGDEGDDNGSGSDNGSDDGSGNGDDDDGDDSGGDDSDDPGDSYYVIDGLAHEGGTITPSSQEVPHGQSAEFTITPDADYLIEEVTGDCSGELNGETYTIAEVSEDCTVEVSFEEEENPYVIITTPEDNTELDQGESLLVAASAFDPEGVNAARLWINDEFHSLASEEPYEFQVDELEPGTHSLMVRTRNGEGEALDSDPVNVVVLEGEDEGEEIQLPIEVLGPDGTQETVSFELNDSSNITHLYLSCNACGYHNIHYDKDSSLTKATVRVNEESPIELKHFIEDGQVYGNPDIDILGGASAYGGIGGGFRTVRFTVPVEGLNSGENRLTFEHVDSRPPSMGFRILELNLIENSDPSRSVLSELAFVDDDPADWEPPLSDPSDIDQGQDLWNQRDILHDPWLESVNPDSGGNMSASCANCHASDGRDLKYFNYSNESIVARSEFHGLSEEEGEKIASYIRNLDMPVVAQARPWNPTYQPGPGLDSVSAYEWAAGAGMDAVLDDHSEMADYLFPDGTSLEEVRNVVDRFGQLNFRELPINIPMPEWKQWLPLIHPDDAFDTSASAIRSDENGQNVGMPYYEKLYQDADNNPTPNNLGALAHRIKEWLRRDQTCSTAGRNSGEPIRGLNGAVLESIQLPKVSVTYDNCLDRLEGDRRDLETYEIAKRGLLDWASVKMWAVMHSKQLEEASVQMDEPVCSYDDGQERCVDASEPRGWVANGRNVFDRPPHFTGVGPGRQFFDQNHMLGIFESNSWYHLNMMLNTGYRRTMPSHFAYTYSHVELLQQHSNVDQGYRFWATRIKERQLQTNGRYGVEAGLDMRTAQPYTYYGTVRHNTRTDTQASVGQPLWRRLAQVMIEDYTADAVNATAEDWANANQNRRVQDRYSTDFSPCSGTCSFSTGPTQGRNTYRVIPELREIGVDEAVLQELIDWAEDTWPNGPWDDVR